MGDTFIIVGILVLIGAGVAFGIIKLVSKRQQANEAPTVASSATTTTSSTASTMPSTAGHGSTKVAKSFLDNIQASVGDNRAPDAASLTLAPPAMGDLEALTERERTLMTTTGESQEPVRYEPLSPGESVQETVTAYLPAFLLASKEGEGRYFRGVGGFGVNAKEFGVSKTIRVGQPAFYGYNTLNGAQQSRRQGNVILEVQFSGELQEDVDGYTAYTAKVTAIHPGTCALCSNQATHFSHAPSIDIVATLCGAHYEKMLSMMDRDQIEITDDFYPVSSEFKHLHRALPWLLDEDIKIG